MWIAFRRDKPFELSSQIPISKPYATREELTLKLIEVDLARFRADRVLFSESLC